MDISVIDLRVFAPRYRQALLFAMIEGLMEGAAFSFSDDRDPNEVENELSSAGLSGYRWARKDGKSNSDTAYLIERRLDTAVKESCCGFCGAQPKEQT